MNTNRKGWIVVVAGLDVAEDVLVLLDRHVVPRLRCEAPPEHVARAHPPLRVVLGLLEALDGVVVSGQVEQHLAEP